MLFSLDYREASLSSARNGIFMYRMSYDKNSLMSHELVSGAKLQKVFLQADTIQKEGQKVFLKSK